jgi:hypothetical protein
VHLLRRVLAVTKLNAPLLGDVLPNNEFNQNIVCAFILTIVIYPPKVLPDP